MFFQFASHFHLCPTSSGYLNSKEEKSKNTIPSYMYDDFHAHLLGMNLKTQDSKMDQNLKEKESSTFLTSWQRNNTGHLGSQIHINKICEGHGISNYLEKVMLLCVPYELNFKQWKSIHKFWKNSRGIQKSLSMLHIIKNFRYKS